MKPNKYTKILFLFLFMTALFPALPSHAAGFLDSLFSSNKQRFLDPDAAFKLTVKVSDGHTLNARFDLAPSYYLYRSKIHFAVKGMGVNVANVDMPPGVLKHDRNLGDQMVFHKMFQAVILLERTNTAPKNITLNASYQGCSEKGLCYPPIDKSFRLTLPAVVAATDAAPPQQLDSNAQQLTQATPDEDSESSEIARLFKKGSFWLVVSFFFGAGLLLAFTPCMFPMVPILSGIIVGRGHKITHVHGFILSFTSALCRGHI